MPEQVTPPVEPQADAVATNVLPVDGVEVKAPAKQKVTVTEPVEVKSTANDELVEQEFKTPTPAPASPPAVSSSATHINAFAAAVDDAKLAVAVAKSNLNTAEAAYKNHPDYVAPVEDKKSK